MLSQVGTIYSRKSLLLFSTIPTWEMGDHGANLSQSGFELRIGNSRRCSMGITAGLYMVAAW